jgi:putative membrane protein
MEHARSRENLLLVGIGAVCLAVSAINPFDWLTWWLEVFPILIAVAVLRATARRFPLTPFLYRLILIHSLILMLGAHYSYARVPPGFWVQDLFDLSRNHYDRLGHFAQGFFPAMVVREVLLRRTALRRGAWLFFLVSSVCLAISAFYEFVEWWAALLAGDGATEFLGTQGDVWDTQWDMFLALVGSVVAQLLLSRPHDRALARLDKNHFLHSPTDDR